MRGRGKNKIVYVHQTARLPKATFYATTQDFFIHLSHPHSAEVKPMAQGLKADVVNFLLILNHAIFREEVLQADMAASRRENGERRDLQVGGLVEMAQ